MSTDPSAAPAPYRNDWPLILAVNVILIGLALAQLRISYQELRANRNAQEKLALERFHANRAYIEMEATFSGLLTLSPVDADARRLVQKYDIGPIGEMERGGADVSGFEMMP
jgi:hypothetical protein